MDKQHLQDSNNNNKKCLSFISTWRNCHNIAMAEVVSEAKIKCPTEKMLAKEMQNNNCLLTVISVIEIYNLF